jgi:hypothetical protein
VPLVLAALVAPFTAAVPMPSWTMPGWFLLPVVLLRPEAAQLTRTAAIRITALVAAATVGALLAAPWLAWRQHARGTTEGREYYRLVGAEVTNAWRLATARPLRTVTGDPRLVYAVAFYSPDHPDPRPGFAEAADATICRVDDEACVDAAKQRTAGKNNVQYMTYSTMSRYLGKPGRLGRFFFILALPGTKEPTVPQPDGR